MENTALHVRSIETASYGRTVRFLIALEELAKNVNLTLIVAQYPLRRAFLMLVLHALRVLIVHTSLPLLSANYPGRLVNVLNASQAMSALLWRNRDARVQDPALRVQIIMIVRSFLLPQYARHRHRQINVLNAVNIATVPLLLLLNVHPVPVRHVPRILIVNVFLPPQNAQVVNVSNV